jgi:hypothetical protein
MSSIRVIIREMKRFLIGLVFIVLFWAARVVGCDVAVDTALCYSYTSRGINKVVLP